MIEISACAPMPEHNRVTDMQDAQHKISPALAAMLQNAAIFFGSFRVEEPNRALQCKEISDCVEAGATLRCDHTSARNAGGNHGDDHRFPARSCTRTFQIGRIQIGPQFMPRHARKALDREHPQGRDFFPLRHSLHRDAKRISQAGEPADGVDCLLQSFFAVSHGR